MSGNIIIEEHLPALQFIARGIGGTVQFPCNSADGTTCRAGDSE